MSLDVYEAPFHHRFYQLFRRLSIGIRNINDRYTSSLLICILQNIIGERHTCIDYSYVLHVQISEMNPRGEGESKALR